MRHACTIGLARAALTFALILGTPLAVGCGGEEGLKIKKIEPNSGNYMGGDQVVIYGNGFQSDGVKGVTVYFGGSKARVLGVKGDTEMVVMAPAGPKGKKVDIAMMFDDSRRKVLKEAYLYKEPGSIEVDDLTNAPTEDK